MSQPRTLHTMLRVKALEKSVQFYTGPMGMKELRRREVPEGKYTLVFVGYAEDSEQAAVELTFNWDQLRPSRGRPAGCLQGLRGNAGQWRQDYAGARAGEVWDNGDRFRRGP